MLFLLFSLNFACFSNKKNPKNATSLQAPAEKITFKYVPPQANSSFSAADNLKVEIDMKFTMNGQPMMQMIMSNIEKKEYRFQYGSTWTDAEKSATIFYGEHSEVKMENGVQKRTEKPIANQTYNISWTNGNQIEIVRADGEAISEKEQELVQESWKTIVEEEDLTFKNIFNGKTVEVGQVLIDDVEMLSKLLSFSDENKKDIVEGKLFLKETKREGDLHLAVMAFTMKLLEEKDDMKITSELKGDIVLDINTMRDHSMTMNGPVRLSGETLQKDAVIKMIGTGQMDGTLQKEY